MTTRQVTCHVVDCGVCPDSLDFGDGTAHFATAEQGIDAAIDNGWTPLGGGRLACNRSNPEHDDARDAAALSPA